jgi:hypothetical protein
MRSAVEAARRQTEIIEPLVPVDLVVDHSVQGGFLWISKKLCNSTWRWSSSAAASVISF